MSVNAALTYSQFVPDSIKHYDSYSGLWIIGRFFGKNQATGDGSGGSVTMSISPLPQISSNEYLPKLESYFRIFGISIRASVAGGSGAMCVYSDEWIGAANMEYRLGPQGPPVMDGEGYYVSNVSGQEQLSNIIGRRSVDQALGSIKAAWVTNTNAGVYLFYANGLLLQTEEWLDTYIRNWREHHQRLVLYEA